MITAGSAIAVAFTGHRPDKLGGYAPNAVKRRVRSELKTALRAVRLVNYIYRAISGMALGVDQLAVEVCAELGIPTTAAVPFQGQELKWPAAAQRKYRNLLRKCSEVVYVSSLVGNVAVSMELRNRWMVDHCDILIAVWDGSPGGTCNCVRYAERHAPRPPEIIRINPATWGASL